MHTRRIVRAARCPKEQGILPGQPTLQYLSRKAFTMNWGQQTIKNKADNYLFNNTNNRSPPIAYSQKYREMLPCWIVDG